ncbi:hypothetical protein [Vitiosangium sp. GDMCC 1.1324]|uniref:hypothetical protein n=1 Tax=Vitiosangium sp. (strain GDMCC 1.1324) TaxID=2138576 RepID=UPI000D390B7F|nr:hypothetical protein [Vitiosangium sp. GDMCC 1.1324]PTL78832.1 hypothetical protein DAT35_37890 [Vitiosangium sp. GDMCC 1.1324]
MRGRAILEHLGLPRQVRARPRHEGDTTGQVLKRMVGASDEDWGQLRQQYENTWKELNEHADRIRSSSVQEQPTSCM